MDACTPAGNVETTRRREKAKEKYGENQDSVEVKLTCQQEEPIRTGSVSHMTRLTF